MSWRERRLAADRRRAVEQARDRAYTEFVAGRDADDDLDTDLDMDAQDGDR